MTVEYKIKFEKDSVTITQRVEPVASGAISAQPDASDGATVSSALASSFDETLAMRPQSAEGGGFQDPAGPGGGAPAGPMVVFGPIVIRGSGPIAANGK
ncbi:MAG: hypothetical protein HUU41_08560 [Bryobacteraceae bacterium]|nr:hypothetical protein [Bryobacterales bacterium]MEB2360097.1 hypothetical protein [Bryobacterales bacterium]NUN01152.1 hypothetical protein [Bryobacteraceae bacterium]